MKVQTTIEKPIIPSSFFSKNTDESYWSNDCFCEIYIGDFSFPFTGKEKDSETGYSYFGARYLDHELMTGWLSVDPMSDKYPSISPYAYCAWNPVKYIDPNGEWIPGLDENNNVILTAEDGDDINTLRDFMGDAYLDVIECLYGTMSNGVINLTESYGCVFQDMTDAINDSPTCDVNCWGTSMSILTNGVVDPHYRYNGRKIAQKIDADLVLIANGISVPLSDANVGQTLVRFSNSGKDGIYPGETTHFATYMGTDLRGQQYVFTKNGWVYNWDIQKTDDFHIPEHEPVKEAGLRFNNYGFPTPLIGDNSPYYNRR